MNVKATFLPSQAYLIPGLTDYNQPHVLLDVIRRKVEAITRVKHADAFAKVPDRKRFGTMSRKKELVAYRHLYIFALLRYTQWSQPHIGLRCGGIDHSSVIHVREKMADLCETDTDTKRMVNKLITSIDPLVATVNNTLTEKGLESVLNIN